MKAEYIVTVYDVDDSYTVCYSKEEAVNTVMDYMDDNCELKDITVYKVQTCTVSHDSDTGTTTIEELTE